MTDTHGKTNLNNVGSHSYEIYNNTYSTADSSVRARSAIGIRGGNGVIFGNEILSGTKINYPIELILEPIKVGDELIVDCSVENLKTPT